MLIGILLGLSFLILCYLVNFLRSPDRPISELTPNCLLTRYPLVFVPGQRSLFYFLKYWNEIPHFLASHGYEVFSLHLAWRKSPQRMDQLQRFLEEKSRSPKEKIHLFVDQSSAGEVANLLRKTSFSCLASLTWVRTEKDSDAFLSELKSLSHPMEEVLIHSQKLTATGGIQSFFWKLHLIATGQDLGQRLETRGYELNPSLKHELLSRTQFIAERDLLQT